MKVLAAAVLAGLALLSSGCGGESAPNETTAAASAPPGEFGSYPANPALDEKEVVEAYVEALDARDGQSFCRVVASWISGRFDIAGTDPDASLRRPVRCPQLVPGLTDFPWENQERDFKGARVADFGDLDRRSDDLVGVPVTITLRLEEYGRGEYEEPLEDVVWLTKEAGAWRVAKLGTIAGWASLVQTERGDDLSAPPDLTSERQAFAADVAEANELRRNREASYAATGPVTACPQGRTYRDASTDVVEYQHPAPPPPTPQLPAADIRTLHVHATADAICTVFEMAGAVQNDSVFSFITASPDSEWGRAGFSFGFEVELRDDGLVRTTTGLDDQRRPVAVPAEIGRSGNRLMLKVDKKSFAAGKAYPGSVARPRPLLRFDLRASATVRASEERLLHDDVEGGPAEDTNRLTYP